MTKIDKECCNCSELEKKENYKIFEETHEVVDHYYYKMMDEIEDTNLDLYYGTTWCLELLMNTMTNILIHQDLPLHLKKEAVIKEVFEILDVEYDEVLLSAYTEHPSKIKTRYKTEKEIEDHPFNQHEEKDLKENIDEINLTIGEHYEA